MGVRFFVGILILVACLGEAAAQEGDPLVDAITRLEHSIEQLRMRGAAPPDSAPLPAQWDVPPEASDEAIELIQARLELLNETQAEMDRAQQVLGAMVDEFAGRMKALEADSTALHPDDPAFDALQDDLNAMMQVLREPAGAAPQTAPVAGSTSSPESDAASDDAALPVPPRAAGLAFEAAYTGEAFANAEGGLERSAAYLHNLDLALTLDAEALMGWRGGTVFLYGLGTYGGSISGLAGDLQGISNIEAPAAFRLYEAWIEQRLAGDRLSFRGGLYDLNSEFYAMEAAGLFIHPSHGIGPELGLSGANGPSIFPVTSLAFRAAVLPTPDTYLLLAAFDGVPGDPDAPEATRIRFADGDGLLLAAEGGWTGGVPGEGPYWKAGAGGWHYTAPFEAWTGVDSLGAPRQGRGNAGVYGLVEGSVWQEADDPTQGLALFGRIGAAAAAYNAVHLAWGAGLVYTGLIPGRPEDTLGLALATAHGSPDYRSALRAGGAQPAAAELALELTYRMPVTPWLTIQPDLQFISQPGLGEGGSYALVVGHRFEIAL